MMGSPGQLRRACLLGTVLAAAIAWDEPAVAYRPFDQTDAAVAEPGNVELELGALGYRSQGGERTLVTPALVFNYGFAPDWEAVIEGKCLWPQQPAVTGAPAFQIDDTGVSLKHVVREGSLQGASGPSVAIELGALLPTLGAGPGMGAAILTVGSQRWPALTLHGNVEAALTRDQHLAITLGAIAEGPDAWPVRPVAEGYVEAESSTGTTFGGTIGAIWSVSDMLSFDLGWHLSQAPDGQLTEFRSGLTWSWAAGKKG